MTRAGVIINPGAGRGNGKGLALAERLKARSVPSVVLLEQFGQLESALRGLAAQGVSDLYVSSGDGTIQAIQTLLVENKIFSSLPRLCLLPHGTTNMTAADLGYQVTSIDAQASAIVNHHVREERARPTLRAVNPADGKPRHGMFFGTGAAAEATLYCQRAFNDNGVKGSYATFATLAGAVARTVFSRPDPHDVNRFDRPFPITARTDGFIICEGPQLMLLATTLDKLILGTRPFWGGKTAPVRVSVFPYPVPNVFRWLIPIMYGAETRKVPVGAKSHAVNWLAVSSPTSWVVDGEFFNGPPAEALRLETGPVFTYIRR